jgi:hypothetical protein
MYSNRAREDFPKVSILEDDLVSYPDFCFVPELACGQLAEDHWKRMGTRQKTIYHCAK